MTDRVRQQYNRRAWFYEHFMDRMRGRSTRYSLLANLPDNLPERAHILDLGCGTGLSGGAILERYPHAHVTGLDFAEDMLAKHQRHLPAIRLIQGDFMEPKSLKRFPDGEQVNLAPASFDLVVSAGALSEYSDVRKSLPWVHSLLKPGGWLVNVGVEKSALGKVTGKIWGFYPGGADMFQRAASAAGFVDVKRGRLPRPVWWKNKGEYVVVAQA